MANVALLGHGVVGSGTARILLEKKDEWISRCGEDIELKYIFVRHDYDVDYTDRFTYDINEILNDDSVDVVVEVMGGTDPAYRYVKAALERGKSVVTSNKQLVAEHGFELMNIAMEHSVNFLFEGAVAGAIPVIHAIRNTLKANDILSVRGIINGTCNYILTKMTVGGESFEDALKDAQELGYAEADPSADVEGLDTARKICILAALCFGRHVYPSETGIEGITGLRKRDTRILARRGETVKLLGVAGRLDGKRIYVRTAPFVITPDSILHSVNGSFNCVEIETDCAGTLSFSGRGAGSMPTASRVVNDICECVTAVSTLYAPWMDSDWSVADFDDIPGRFYVNVSTSLKREEISSRFLGAEMLRTVSGERAFIVDHITRKDLEKRLADVRINSILRYI